MKQQIRQSTHIILVILSMVIGGGGVHFLHLSLDSPVIESFEQDVLAGCDEIESMIPHATEEAVGNAY